MSKNTPHLARGNRQGGKISSLGFQQRAVRTQLVGDPHLPRQGPRGRATCLHDAAGSWDVLRDTDFIAALQEDGSVVVDIQHGHVHGGGPGAPVPGGAVVWRDRKERFSHLLFAQEGAQPTAAEITGSGFLN